MAKKYRPKALEQKPQSTVPPSLQLSKVATALQSDEDVAPSVNDLIHRLRHIGSSHERTSGLARHQTTASIPPSVRKILDLPDMPPPQPREGIRTGPHRSRRIPAGPSPPQSWLSNSCHAPEPASRLESESRLANRRLQQQTCNLPGHQFPPPNSLQHMVLKAMASNWSWHAKYAQMYLSSLPLFLKETLLSYIGLYDDDTSTNPLDLIFPTEGWDLDNGNMNDVQHVSRLDLTKMINPRTSVKQVAKRLLLSRSRISMERRLDSTTAAAVSAQNSSNDTRDSWDTAYESDEGFNNSFSSLAHQSPTPFLRFSNLRHLSLAVSPHTPGHIASWSSLLSIAPDLSILSSLSLAYWPLPTYTPNAASTHITMQNPLSASLPRIRYGGSDIYTPWDADWKEASGILRSLSRSLYCLNWLDLTGCAEWLRALTWKCTRAPSFEDASMTKPSITGNLGPDWNGSWRGIEHIVIAVGWTPFKGPIGTRTHAAALQALRGAYQIDSNFGSLPGSTTGILSQLPGGRRVSGSAGSQPGRKDGVEELGWDVEEEREKYYIRKEVESYLNYWTITHKIADELQRFRRDAGGKRIEFDFGEITS